MSVFMGGTAAVGGLNTKVTFTDSDSTNTNQSTYTRTGVPFLTASARRLVIVGFRCSNLTANLSAPSACTIGGVSATLILQDPAGTALSHRQIWAAAVPSGTSGTVTITRAANMTGQVFFAWVGENLKTFTNVGTLVTANADPSSGSLTTLPGGIAVAFGLATSASGFTWTNLTEDVDSTLGTISYTGASQSKIATSSVTITLDTNVACQLFAASWR